MLSFRFPNAGNAGLLFPVFPWGAAHLRAKAFGVVALGGKSDLRGDLCGGQVGVFEKRKAFADPIADQIRK